MWMANQTLLNIPQPTGFVKAEGRHQMSDETVAKLDEVYALVKDGTIVPPSNFSEGSTPENFPGLN